MEPILIAIGPEGGFGVSVYLSINSGETYGSKIIYLPNSLWFFDNADM